jgi:hypothetical protein
MSRVYPLAAMGTPATDAVKSLFGRLDQIRIETEV